MPVEHPGFPQQGFPFHGGQHRGMDMGSVLAAAPGKQGESQPFLDHFQAGIHGIGFDDGKGRFLVMGVPPVIQHVLEQRIRHIVDIGIAGQEVHVQGILAEGTERILPQETFLFVPVVFTPDDADVVFAFQEIPIPVMAEPAFHVDLDPGIGFPELGEDPGHVVLGENIGTGNGQGASRVDPGIGKGILDFLIGGFCLEKIPVQQLSLGSELDASGLAQKKSAAEFCLQALQPVGQGWLGEEQPFGGMGDVLFFIQGFQQQDILIVHGWPPHFKDRFILSQIRINSYLFFGLKTGRLVPAGRNHGQFLKRKIPTSENQQRKKRRQRKLPFFLFQHSERHKKNRYQIPKNRYLYYFTENSTIETSKIQKI